MALMAFSDSEVHNDKTCSKSCLKNYESLKKQYDDLVAKKHETEFKAITYKRGLDTVEAQLVTYRKNEVLFSEEVVVLKREVGIKQYEINTLKTEFEKLKQEKDAIDFKIEKFGKASKDLDQLLGSQITDKSKKGFGYSAVPPPHPLIYNRPNKLDLSYSGLDEFKEPEFKGYGPENSKKESNVVSSLAEISTSEQSTMQIQTAERSKKMVFVSIPLKTERFKIKKLDDFKYYTSQLVLLKKATPKKARKYKKVASPSRKLSPVLEEEPVVKPKKSKKPTKKLLLWHRTVSSSEISLVDEFGSQPKVPDESEDKTTGTDEGTETNDKNKEFDDEEYDELYKDVNMRSKVAKHEEVRKGDIRSKEFLPWKKSLLNSKHVDHSAHILTSIKSQILVMVDEHLATRIRFTTQTARQSYTAEFEKKAQEEKDRYRISMTNLLRISSKIN
ncbi:hypothetical protein Tco_0712880 [Tanacetum coccineum]